MTTSLLPFITEKSSDAAIFKAIVQRTKGSSVMAITNLFSVIQHMGIKGARVKVDSYHSDLTTKDKLAELVAEHPAFHIPKSEGLFWSCVMRNEQVLNPVEHYPQYSTEERAILFSVLAVVSATKLEKTEFALSFDKHKKYSEYQKESFDVNLRDLKFVKITEKESKRLGFSSIEEIKAFVAFNEIEERVINVFPVQVGTSFSVAEYTKKHCDSPYTRSQE